MGSLGDQRAILVLLGAFVIYRAAMITADHYQLENLASYLQFLWLALVAYTRIGAGLFQNALRSASSPRSS